MNIFSIVQWVHSVYLLNARSAWCFVWWLTQAHITGPWLVNTGQMTWILASDWSGLVLPWILFCLVRADSALSLQSDHKIKCCTNKYINSVTNRKWNQKSKRTRWSILVSYTTKKAKKAWYDNIVEPKSESQNSVLDDKKPWALKFSKSEKRVFDQGTISIQLT